MIESLIRPNIARLKPYVCARHISQEGILFDANENAFGSVVTAPLDGELNRYPDPSSLELRTALSKFLNVDICSTFIGVGSDEVIDLLMRIFVDPDEEILIFEPTYGMYRVAGEINGVKIKTCLLNEEFQIDFSEFSKMVTKKTKMIFLASPNSPTGNLIKEVDIEKLCKTFRGIVVVDEAYVEFSSESSFVSRVKDFENLVVLRTFSKAWGLAGLRVGYCIANPKTIEYLNKIKPPYNLNRLSSFLAVKALENYEKLFEFRDKITQERKRLAHELKKLGCKVFPSEANFLMVQVPDASGIVKKLARDGLIVRDFSTKPRLKDCFRISVGTPEQNRLLIQALSQIL